jgi:uncharacterized protein (UPF0333 family)
MFKLLHKNKKGQNTAEYAILISLVVAAIVAMQVYAQRALQARVRDASKFLTDVGGNTLGNTQQYEPYYQESSYTIDSSSDETRRLGTNQVELATNETRTRNSAGKTTTTYNEAGFSGVDSFQ